MERRRPGRRLADDRRSITNTRSKGLIEKDTKTHAERRLSLDASTVAVLTEHQRTVTEFVVRCGGELGADAFVVSHEHDASTPWRPDYASLAFTRLRTRAGSPTSGSTTSATPTGKPINSLEDGGLIRA